MANLLLAMLHKLGLRVETIGDGIERLSIQPASRLAASRARVSSMTPVTEFRRGFQQAARASRGNTP
jgi:hypothetical protein